MRIIKGTTGQKIAPRAFHLLFSKISSLSPDDENEDWAPLATLSHHSPSDSLDYYVGIAFSRNLLGVEWHGPKLVPIKSCAEQSYYIYLYNPSGFIDSVDNSIGRRKFIYEIAVQQNGDLLLNNQTYSRGMPWLVYPNELFPEFIDFALSRIRLDAKRIIEYEQNPALFKWRATRVYLKELLWYIEKEQSSRGSKDLIIPLIDHIGLIESLAKLGLDSLSRLEEQEYSYRTLEENIYLSSIMELSRNPDYRKKLEECIDLSRVEAELLSRTEKERNAAYFIECGAKYLCNDIGYGSAREDYVNSQDLLRILEWEDDVRNMMLSIPLNMNDISPRDRDWCERIYFKRDRFLALRGKSVGDVPHLINGLTSYIRYILRYRKGAAESALRDARHVLGRASEELRDKEFFQDAMALQRREGNSIAGLESRLNRLEIQNYILLQYRFVSNLVELAESYNNLIKKAESGQAPLAETLDPLKSLVKQGGRTLEAIDAIIMEPGFRPLKKIGKHFNVAGAVLDVAWCTFEFSRIYDADLNSPTMPQAEAALALSSAICMAYISVTAVVSWPFVLFGMGLLFLKFILGFFQETPLEKWAAISIWNAKGQSKARWFRRLPEYQLREEIAAFYDAVCHPEVRVYIQNAGDEGAVAIPSVNFYILYRGYPELPRTVFYLTKFEVWVERAVPTGNDSRTLWKIEREAIFFKQRRGVIMRAERDGTVPQSAFGENIFKLEAMGLAPSICNRIRNLKIGEGEEVLCTLAILCDPFGENILSKRIGRTIPRDNHEFGKEFTIRAILLPAKRQAL